jgi:hypothetical protein
MEVTDMTSTDNLDVDWKEGYIQFRFSFGEDTLDVLGHEHEEYRDYVRAAFYEIAGTGNSFSVLYHFFELNDIGLVVSSWLDDDDVLRIHIEIGEQIQIPASNNIYKIIDAITDANSDPERERRVLTKEDVFGED